MHTKEPREDPLLDLGYEGRDVNYGSLGRWSVIFFAFIGFSLAVGAAIWWFGFAHDRIAINDASRHVVPGSPNPLLQTSVTTKTDIMTLRQNETRELGSTGWVDQPHGIVHIPIDQAIGMVATGQHIQTGKVVPAQNPHNTTDQNPSAVTATGRP